MHFQMLLLQATTYITDVAKALENSVTKLVSVYKEGNIPIRTKQ